MDKNISFKDASVARRTSCPMACMRMASAEGIWGRSRWVPGQPAWWQSSHSQFSPFPKYGMAMHGQVAKTIRNTPYPLVNIQKTIEGCHLSLNYPLKMVDLSIVMLGYQRAILDTNGLYKPSALGFSFPIGHWFTEDSSLQCRSFCRFFCRAKP